MEAFGEPDLCITCQLTRSDRLWDRVRNLASKKMGRTGTVECSWVHALDVPVYTFFRRNGSIWAPGIPGFGLNLGGGVQW